MFFNANFEYIALSVPFSPTVFSISLTSNVFMILSMSQNSTCLGKSPISPNSSLPNASFIFSFNSSINFYDPYKLYIRANTALSAFFNPYFSNDSFIYNNIWVKDMNYTVSRVEMIYDLIRKVLRLHLCALPAVQQST